MGSVVEYVTSTWVETLCVDVGVVDAMLAVLDSSPSQQTSNI